MRDDDSSTCGKPADGGGEAATRDDGADTMMTTPAGKPADGAEAAMRDDDTSGCGSGQRMKASESTSCENGDVACKNYFRKQAGGPNLEWPIQETKAVPVFRTIFVVNIDIA
uniref:Uncharacterized protein n=1 Tax=Oryza sativa subsp. japonica TaxID=39947 RepID=Q6ZKD4_ORYSJ|nr:hypothetical protein [Oryza sativa Japonica Group]